MPHQTVPLTKRAFARKMRREPSEAEDRLWHELRGRRLNGIKVRRQVPIGRYVVDFVCVEAMLVIELDGSQHAESTHDLMRDADLKARGFRVLRFWNDDVLKDMNSVCDTIFAYVRDMTLRPWRWVSANLSNVAQVPLIRPFGAPSPTRGEGKALHRCLR